MEFIVIGLIILIGAFFGIKQYKKLEKNKDRKRQEEIERVRQEERRRAQEEADRRAREEAERDPCRDLRDGTFNPAYTPAQAAQHGYFWCSVAKATLNKSANVNQCGSQPHLVG